MCKIYDCEKKVFGRGMCSMHYFREKRSETKPVDIEEIEIQDVEDFWQFVKKELNLA